MATYIYETIPKNAKQKPRRFEVQQKMSDPPLKTDPETGLPVRRVIIGGVQQAAEHRAKSHDFEE